MTLDPRFGYFVNHDLAEYHVPVHADIPAIDAIFLAELDDQSKPLKSKGIGELGICGAGASIANAIYNACGARIRDDPITLDKLLSALPLRALAARKQWASGGARMIVFLLKGAAAGGVNLV
jgi:xanthine dehydrogenase YagR molybdenum-binding subunit